MDTVVTLVAATEVVAVVMGHRAADMANNSHRKAIPYL